MAGTTRAFIHSPALERYAYPPSCPFTTHRAARTRKTLASMGLLTSPGCIEVEPVPAPRATLEWFHHPEYLDVLHAAEGGELSLDALRMGLGTDDCPVFRGMCDYAVLAVGATLRGAELILADEARVAFNPSGGYHHAHAARAAGFCYLNDVALGCMTLARHGKRVLFLDIDVHHCDGVQEAFYARSDVMTVSFHQNGHTLFPGTGFEREIGNGDGLGYTVNCPLPPGTYDEAYLRAFKAIALPLIGAFNPDIIVMEIGADTLAGDPLAGLNLTNNVFPEIIDRVLGFGKPILATGGGGYHVENTVRAWALAWTALCENEQSADLMTGMGGVMLQSTDWQGGLRDRPLMPDVQQRPAVNAAIDQTIRTLQDLLFPLHGL
ncbi:MAG: hypothetical protein A3K19_00285 [Lentisphaerae bacterium RIFOXYB12_FULL_65_16]|nr:MAG: hypothetical protein A3K18_34345 [Lentisphaerae bacterium RIFOXYA12_64_32]OGV85353.1 MAG: hypothetical protein A3K19_00285 [Lentisphaerae bacterium RIFOXYB12_FULL_65_16]